MIKKRKIKQSNKVFSQDFGQFLEWEQKKKSLKKISQEVILQQYQKKDNQNQENDYIFIINLKLTSPTTFS